MLSSPTLSESELISQATERLQQLLDDVPFVQHWKARSQIDQGVDLLIDVAVDGQRHTLAIEARLNGQPRHVHAALAQLERYIARSNSAATPVLVAPYLSPEAQALCRETGAGFLDLEGNCRLVFATIFIDRQVPTKPQAERRRLKSLFRPKSAQVLRLLLRDPQRAWRVTELAEGAGVSLGQVSNVRTALRDREWATTTADGLVLTRPGALLDAWRAAYEPPAGERRTFYTTLHGGGLGEALRATLPAANEAGNAMLASFSAAQWLAPFGRTGSQFFYADAPAMAVLESRLKLAPATKGENIVIIQPKNIGLFIDALAPAPDIRCTGLAQTYLDLSLAGERGREAAEHLRQERLAWTL